MVYLMISKTKRWKISIRLEEPLKSWPIK